MALPSGKASGTAPRGGAAGTALRAEALGARLPPLLVAAERVAATVAQGVHGRRRVGPGESFWQFRRFADGDSPQRIDWRQSARAQHLYVRESEWTAAQSVWLWYDRSASMDWRSDAVATTKLDRAALLALALGSLLVRGGERVAELGSGQPASGGRTGYNRLAASLLGTGTTGTGTTGTGTAGTGIQAHVKAEAEASGLPPRQHLPRHAQVVLISDFLSPLAELEALVKAHVAAGVRGHLMQVLDPAEIDLPYRGRTRFLGLEGEAAFLAARAEDLRPAYAERLARRQDALASLARSAGWTFALHRTDQRPETALMALFGALSARAV